MDTSNTSPVVSTVERGIRSASNLILALSERGPLLGRRRSEPALSELPLFALQSITRDWDRERQPPSIAVANEGNSAISSGSSAPDIEQESSGIDVHQTAASRVGAWHYITSTFSWNRDPSESSARKENKKAAELEYKKCKSKHPTVDDYPAGISRLAKLQHSDDDVAIFRGFHLLHTRALEHLEIGLTDSEDELFAQDHRIAVQTQGEGLKNIAQYDTWNNDEKKLIPDIISKLRTYDELLLRFADIRALGRPHKRHHRSLFYWMWNYEPLSDESKKFIYHADDFVSVAGTQSDFFETLTQAFLHTFPKPWLMRLFTSKENKEKNTNQYVAYFSEGRTWGLANFFQACLAVGILLAPVFLLFLIPMSRGIMALILSTFLFIFAAAMTFMGKAKVHEVFAGTATYGAVLVVFLGNITRGTT